MALDIQQEFLILIEKEDFIGIENLLEKRKDFYIKYSEYNSLELKELLNSKEFKDSEIKINLSFNIAKENVKKEIDKLKASKNAAKQYQNNSGYRNMFFNKKI